MLRIGWLRFLVAQHSQNEKFCFRAIVATQKLYELLSWKKPQSQQPSTDPYYANTGLQNGDALTGLVGFEWDAVVNNGFTPAGLTVLSQSPVSPTTIALGLPVGKNLNISNAVRYTAASSAKVFSTGSIQWMWGLDSDKVTNPRVDPRAQQIAVNVFKDMKAIPTTPRPGLVV